MGADLAAHEPTTIESAIIAVGLATIEHDAGR
jgi:hypothetical protein